MGKPWIKYTTCESGDWCILEANLGETFYAAGHSISEHNWMDLLCTLGFEVDVETISDEEMEERC